MAFIEIQNLTHIFKNINNTNEYLALDNINLEINRGEFVAIIGVNGSGKSTLAKHINGLLLPTSGTVKVNGFLVDNTSNIWNVRQDVSMVFQNPDNQIIATVVEDDIAFGPENLGITPTEIRQRVDGAMNALGIYHLRHMAPHLLSGGQKQLIAIAGALAMRTNCIILDEPTAMLDPQGRKLVISALHELNKKHNLTIILITHFMDEAIGADRVVVMDNGKIAIEGVPRKLFQNIDILVNLGLAVPLAVDISLQLRKKGLVITENILTNDELVQSLITLKDK